MTATGKLSGKTTVVTGAASGIGRAIAKRFAAEGAAAVVIADVNVAGGQATAEAISAAGSRGIFVECDVADPEPAPTTPAGATRSA